MTAAFGLEEAARAKQAVRERVWALLERERVARFPGAKGRIPNFAGASAAAARLASLPAWRTARVVKANPDGGLLAVIDVATTLSTAMRTVFGEVALIQPCTLHKRRNVRDHLPKDQQAWVDRKLAAAFNHDDPAKGERACRGLAAQLQARWPDAAASRREGLQDLFTVRRLGVGGRLAASLTNTNCIQSMLSIARDTTRNVQRWRDGTMSNRWCAAGMRNPDHSFRRLKGDRQMPTFVAALARHGEAVPPACDAVRVA